MLTIGLLIFNSSLVYAHSKLNRLTLLQRIYTAVKSISSYVYRSRDNRRENSGCERWYH